MPSASELLKREGNLSSRVLDRVEQYFHPGLLELKWHRSDFGRADEDTGVALRVESRHVILAVITGELRYFAASEITNDPEWDYEVGVMPRARKALLFCEKFLLEQIALRDIIVPRLVLRGCLNVVAVHSIARMNTDVSER